MTFGGRYTVIRTLGEGAMGQVWEARHDVLQKRCALKVLSVFPCCDTQERRFIREARALASIDSPYVAQVTDFGHEPGMGLYYVMQFVEGETIEERLSRERRLRTREALDLAIDLCAALQDVHDHGVIHRDIKPSNISIPHNGPVHVKLLDFGLAVSLENSFIGRVTTSRTLIGSLAYIAPEVIQDHPLTPSVDLYALGVVLYECLSGRLPFAATTAATFIKECLTSSIPPFADIVPELDIPPQLEAVVARLLDRDQTQRFSSARAARRALESIAM
jgi:serine/threonine-protein kinase